MTDPIFSDDAMRSARIALEGLARREEMIGRNVANVDTPGYKAMQVDFESALSSEMKSSGNLRLMLTEDGHQASSEGSTLMNVTRRAGGSERADGNNVDIDVELAQMTETGLRYQTLVQLVSKKVSLLRTLATGR